MSASFTATTLITDALTDIGVLGVGRPLTDRDAQLALRYLQELIDTAAGKRLSIYTVGRNSFTWTANQQTRTIGPSGQLVLDPRPFWIASATAVRVGETDETPLTIWKRKQWLYELDKDATDAIPQAIYMESGQTNNTINAWPIPDTAFTLWLGTPTALSGFANLTTTYTFPEGGYREWFRKELALRLARPFGKRDMIPELKIDAKEAFGQVQQLNDDGPPIMAPNDLGGMGFYDVYTDSYGRGGSS